MTRWGRRLGRPGPHRLTAPVSMRCGKTTASCRCPGVSTRVISGPPPSARRWTVGLNPPRLRPRASDSASLFWPQPRVGGLGPSCHRYNGRPNAAGHGHRLGLAPPPRAGSSGPSHRKYLKPRRSGAVTGARLGAAIAGSLPRRGVESIHSLQCTCIAPGSCNNIRAEQYWGEGGVGGRCSQGCIYGAR
jgi:hypothetical protein